MPLKELRDFIDRLRDEFQVYSGSGSGFPAGPERPRGAGWPAEAAPEHRETRSDCH